MPTLKDPAHTEGAFTPVTIIVDDREKSAVPALLKSDPEVVMRRERLDPGDYAVADGHVLVERKSMADFVGSLRSGRLFAQVDELRRVSHRPVLIVEGDFYEYRLIAHEARRGAALFVARYWTVSFIQSKDAKDTAAWLKTLARHVLEGAQEPRVPKPKDLAGQQMRMLQGINGIGPGRARDLLEHFGTPAAVVNATLEELAAVVGPATAEKFFTFVRAQASGNRRAV
ncbi:ERCC4 domain-containing protein [Anaeromyxobacter soli]|uniref:ERCC4 domain-containing protein n=1 Tax=Anaeromyxobacter soli TaxID=2922725 RepID=UPI001FAFA353|nr:ERCC4 domain-containing protein [Anaeromyxobacter sp. SG29]